MANGTVKLTRTPGATGNRKTYTLSYWIKRGDLTEIQQIWNVYSAGSDYMYMRFIASGALYLESYTGGASNIGFTTNRLFRDPGAWYHIVLAVDTAQSVSTDRWKLYVNGVQETSFSSSSYSTEDVLTSANTDTFPLYIGANQDTDQGFSGVMAHVHLTDGTAYAPTAFGEFDTTSGIWIAKTSPSVTYGDNGFFLKFASGALGTDSSGEGNNMTVSGTMTNTKDTPDNNFCTFNPLDNYYQASTFANGNNTITQAASNYTWNTATIGLTSGKWYWECKGGTNIASVIVAICSKLSPGSTTEITSDAASITMEMGSGGVLKGGSSQYSGTAYTTSNVCGIAMDLDNNKYYLALDNVWKNSGVPTSGATGTGAVDITTPIPNTGFYFPAQADPSSSAGGECFWNFGNGYFGTTAVTSAEADGNGEGQFEYAPPSGYFAICTNNLGSES